MGFIERDIGWDETNIFPILIYFALALLTSIYFIYKSESKYKIELGVLSFFILTGNINDWLTIIIPGFSFFEIQPDRFLFFLFAFLIFRKIVTSKFKVKFPPGIPLFLLVAALLLASIAISQYSHIDHMDISDIIVNVLYIVSFLTIIVGLSIVADNKFIDTLGKIFILAGIVSSIVSIIQIGIDPMFMRYGDYRIAFGDTIRSNGIFSTEYFNSYFLIISIAWAFHTIWNKSYGIFVIGLLSIGVITSFHRMSWLILFFVVTYYIFTVLKVSWPALFISSLSTIAVFLLLFIQFQKEIERSSLVKERVNEKVDSRFGYYQMVIDHIGKQPIFGYGDNDNEIYYENLLRITRSRNRASGETGDLHSGYFSTLWHFGIPSFMLFILFVSSASIYFYRLQSVDSFYAIIFAMCIIFMISNLTNTLLFDKYLATLLAIHLGLGLGMRFSAITSNIDNTSTDV